MSGAPAGSAGSSRASTGRTAQPAYSASATTPPATAAVPTTMPGSPPCSAPAARTRAFVLSRTAVPTVTARARPWRISTPCCVRRHAMLSVHGSMIRRPMRAGSRVSGGTPSSPPATTSNNGVNATSACRAVNEPAAMNMNRRTSAYACRSRTTAVLAASSMMIGDSISSAHGNTTPPYAARLTVDSGRRAITALTSGSSSPMSSQLPASGSHVDTTARVGSEAAAGRGGEVTAAR